MKNKIAVVTGCCSGIGASVKNRLLEQGATVIGIDIEEYKNESYFCADVSDEAQMIDAFRKISEKYDHIDYLVNCAGIFFANQRSSLMDMEVAELETVWRINFLGSFLTLKYALPLLLKSDSASVINLSSDQTVKAQKNNLAYLVSKDSVNALTKTAALELCNCNIRVNAVAAASVRTHFIDRLFSAETLENVYRSENRKMPLGLIEPDDVTELVIFLLSEKSKKITGQIYLIDAGKLL